MIASLAHRLEGRLHFAWIVVGVVFLVLLAGAGVRSSPSVLIVPLQNAFGWDKATISAAISVNIALYGLLGPFAAAVMQRFGIRRTVLWALGLMRDGLDRHREAFLIAGLFCFAAAFMALAINRRRPQPLTPLPQPA